MDKIITPIQAGGFPLFEEEVVGCLQDQIYNAYFSSLYRFTNESFVLSGCEISNIITASTTVNISAGYVFLNNSTNGTDIVYFSGVTSATYPCYLSEGAQIVTDLEFQNGTELPALSTKQITVTNSIPATSYIEFNPYTSKTLQKLSQRYNRFIGEVFDYVGSLTNSNGFPLFDNTGKGLDYFDGFALCNGNNGTQNLNGRVTIGIGGCTDINGNTQTFTFNEVGGELSHLNTSAESGLRTFQVQLPILSSGSGGGYTEPTDNSPSNGNAVYTSLANGVVNVDGVSGRNGAQDALNYHNNLQPYCTTYKIQRIN